MIYCNDPTLVETLAYLFMITIFFQESFFIQKFYLHKFELLFVVLLATNNKQTSYI